MNEDISQFLRLLLSRLERVNADSVWAHRASGIRGALLKTQQEIETGHDIDLCQAERQMQSGFEILERAGKERIRRSGPG